MARFISEWTVKTIRAVIDFAGIAAITFKITRLCALFLFGLLVVLPAGILLRKVLGHGYPAVRRQGPIKSLIA